MPWQHCEQEVLDDSPCPECGVTKDAWTVEFEATRTFVVHRRPAVRFDLLAGDDEPVPDEPYELVVGDAEPVSGRLDDLGFASVACAEAESAELRFTERSRDELEAPEGVEPGEGAADEPPAVYSVPLRRLTFRLRTRLQLQLHRGDDALADQAYELELPGDERRAGTTDGEGLLEEWIPSGVEVVYVHLQAEDPCDATTLSVRLRRFEPADDPKGLQRRLANLGYLVGDLDGQPGAWTQAALRAYQAKEGLPVTGEADAETIARLTEKHGY